MFIITRDLNYTYDDIVLRRHQTAFGDEHWGRQVFFFFFWRAFNSGE